MKTYKKLIKKDAKERAIKELKAKHREEYGDIVVENVEFNPYRPKKIILSPKGDVEYVLSSNMKKRRMF